MTHHENKYAKYKDGKIKEFIVGECKKPVSCDIDETSLNSSHRNNKPICDYSSKLYDASTFKPIVPCNCRECRNYKVESQGLYLVRKDDVEHYLERFKPVQLRWNNQREVNPNYPVYNFGESKGKTFHRVIIYPTEDMEKWVYKNSYKLTYSARAKFYVAITRAKYSVAIITDFKDGIKFNGVQLYSRSQR